MNTQFKILLGYTKRHLNGLREPIYLEGFKWDCGWYWGGGYLGNRNMHTHFDGCFLETPDIRGHSLGRFVTPWTKRPEYYKTDAEWPRVVVSNGCSIWEDINTFLDDVPKHIQENWWRIKDLYKQFYIYKSAAEAFKHGGHCTSSGRKPAEINADHAALINNHIETVIIPEIMKALEVD